MRNHLKTIDELILPGASRITWSFIGIEDFCSKCENLVTNLENLAKEIEKTEKNIKSCLIEEIELFNLIIIEVEEDGLNNFQVEIIINI